jgi:formate dehydrogenase iron-sulfur subunit
MSIERKSQLSRRAFLKQIGLGATAMVAAHALGSQAQPVHASESPAGQGWGMLIDLTRCVGCNSCALACKAANNLPNADVEPQALGSDSYTFVDTRALTTAEGQTETRFVKRQCMHCLDAACVSACPAAAMYKSDEGPVIYRAERCLGCRYCQVACPFGVPSFEWDNGITPVISKCWLCYQRLQTGQKPACAEACPTGALRFGQRHTLLAQAHAQIASNPGRYVDHIFGEFEVGGTSILYLSDISFDELGFPVDLPNFAPPQQTEKIMNTLPFVITGVAALLAGITAYTHHKSKKSLGSENQNPVEVELPHSSGGEEG